jgi:HAD superfamily hydrolase (TIGR01459 family)
MYIFHGLSEIADKYDLFLVDLWGVLHDGELLYPNALDTLTKLNQFGKKVIFISNAPRKNEIVAKILDGYKIPKEFYQKIVTSGDVTHNFLSEANILGSKYYYVGPDRDSGLLAELKQYQEVKKAEEADFLLACGFDNWGDRFESRVKELDSGLKNHLPMVCANPDKIVVKQNGSKMLCSGEMASYYKEKGGEVLYFGKPYEAIYQRAVKDVAGFDKARTIAIGDGIETDVKGANDFGIKSLFVASGIAAKELKLEGIGVPKREDLKSFVKKYNVEPYGVIPSFVW